MDGDHGIEACARVTLEVQNAVFEALYRHNVDLRYMLLKPNMVLPGSDAPKVPPRDIARATLDVMEQSVPVAVPSINFLSGGQSDVEATENLQAINHEASSRQLPWLLSFSYGRALQAPVLHAWQGKSANEEAAQAALFHRAAMNGAAVNGAYASANEHLPA
jgi:fructose-bisphosphate aldolase class I